MKFKSNVENILYNLFDELCHRLKYNPAKHSKRRRNSEAEEITWIDGGDYILRREVYPKKSIPQVRIYVVAHNNVITQEDLRIKIFGINPAQDTWWLYSKLNDIAALNKKYHSRKADPNKIEKTIEELINFLKG